MKIGLSPKKAKILSKEEIEEFFISGLNQHLLGESIDPICGEEIPGDLVAVARLTALAIVGGCRDPLSPIRQYMVEQERWEVKNIAEGDDIDDDDDDDDDGGEEAFLDDDGPDDADLDDFDDADDDFGERLRMGSRHDDE